MANLNSYQVHAVILAAGDVVQIDVTGEYVGCIKSDDIFRVGVDNNTKQPLEQGLTFRTVEGENFTSIQIENTSDEENEIRLAIGEGQITDSRLSLNSSININGIADPVDIASLPDVKETVAATFIESTDKTINNGATVALNATGNQREIIISAEDTNTGPIRIGETTSTGQGLKLWPGGVISLPVNVQLYAKNNSGASQKFTFVRIAD